MAKLVLYGEPAILRLVEQVITATLGAGNAKVYTPAADGVCDPQDHDSEAEMLACPDCNPRPTRDEARGHAHQAPPLDAVLPPISYFNPATCPCPIHVSERAAEARRLERATDPGDLGPLRMGQAVEVDGEPALYVGTLPNGKVIVQTAPSAPGVVLVDPYRVRAK